MEEGIDNNAIISRVLEAHELVEKLKTKVLAEEEKKMMRRVMQKSLFYFLITLMVGCILGMLYAGRQTDNRLSIARKTGILTLSDGSMFELAPIAPRNQTTVVATGSAKQTETEH
jgi:hypothetical protein